MALMKLPITLQTIIFPTILFGAIIGLPERAYAGDEEQARQKVKDDLLMPECSWSKMGKEEYKACQKERDTMKVMTPEERGKYLRHKNGETVVDGDPGGLLRNKVIVNRQNGGGRR